MPYDLVMIGAGFTGATFLIHFSLKPENLQKKIIIIDPYITGRGPAYQKNDAGLLLNVPAFRMSLYPDQPLDFVNWLQKNNYQSSQYDFVPRSIYGDYVEDTFYQKIKLFSHIVLLKEMAVALKPINSLYQIEVTNCEPIESKQVLLAIGSPPPTNILNLPGEENYIANPCIISRLKNIPKTDAVFILGKGLTALDLLHVFHEHQAPVILQSRHGRFPRPHLPLTDELVKRTSQIHFEISEKPTILEIMDIFRKKIADEKIPWQLAMDVLRHQIPKIWPKLSTKDKKRFISKLKPIWNVHRHRSPISSLAQVEKSLQDKKLELIKGEVGKVEKSGQDFIITVNTKSGTLTRKVRWIINATGPNYNIQQHPSLLIQQMVNEGILKPDPLNFGISLNDDHQLMRNLYFIGPLTLSRYLESTSVPDLRNQAKLFAQKLSD